MTSRGDPACISARVTGNWTACSILRRTWFEGEIREIGTAAGVQSGMRAVAADDPTPFREAHINDFQVRTEKLRSGETVLSELQLPCFRPLIAQGDSADVSGLSVLLPFLRVPRLIVVLPFVKIPPWILVQI